jgi:hypothetical protein
VGCRGAARRVRERPVRRVVADRPTELPEPLGDLDREKAQRVMQAMLSMKKIKIDELERAAAPA